MSGIPDIKQNIAFRSTRLPLRFWEMVTQEPGGCWRWSGKDGQRPKFRIRIGERTIKSTAVRYAYEALVCSLPRATLLSCECGSVHCVNPAHWEPVDRRELAFRKWDVIRENAAKAFCVNGHAFAGENVRWTPDGKRECRACCRERARGRRGGAPRQFKTPAGRCRDCGRECRADRRRCDKHLEYYRAAVQKHRHKNRLAMRNLMEEHPKS